MKEQLISLETAKLLKQKGIEISSKYFYTDEFGLCYLGHDGEFLFNEEGKHQYDCNGEFEVGERYYAPTQSLVQKHLRENNIVIEINLDQTSYPKYCFSVYKYSDFGNWEDIKNPDWGLYGKYESALEAGLQLSLKSM